MRLDQFLDRLASCDRSASFAQQVGSDATGRYFAERAASTRVADPLLEAAMHFTAMHNDTPASGGKIPSIVIIDDDIDRWRHLGSEYFYLATGLGSPSTADSTVSVQESSLGGVENSSYSAGSTFDTPVPGEIWQVGEIVPESVECWPKELQVRVLALMGAWTLLRIEQILCVLAPRMDKTTLLTFECQTSEVESVEAWLARSDDLTQLSSFDTFAGRLYFIEGYVGGGSNEHLRLPSAKPFTPAVEKNSQSFSVRLLSEFPRIEHLLSFPSDSGQDSVLEARSAMKFLALRKPRILADPDVPSARTFVDPNFSVRPLTITTIRDGRFNGFGLVLDREDRLHEESFMPPIAPGEFTSWGRNYPLDREAKAGHVGFLDQQLVVQPEPGVFRPRVLPKETDRRIAGPVLLVTGLYHHVFGHWMFDVMSKLWALPWLDAQGLGDAKIALPSPLTDKQREMLSLLGVTDERIVLLRRDEWLVADQLLVPSRPARIYDFMAPEVFELYDTLADRALEAETVDSSIFPKRIYVARQTKAGRRRLLNEAEICDKLGHYGYHPIEFSKLSIAEEVALFRKADAIAAPHGSALAGMAFMRPSAKVTCFFVSEWLKVIRHNFTISAQRDLDVTCVLGHSFGARIDFSPWVVDSRLIDEALQV